MSAAKHLLLVRAVGPVCCSYLRAAGSCSLLRSCGHQKPVIVLCHGAWLCGFQYQEPASLKVLQVIASCSHWSCSGRLEAPAVQFLRGLRISTGISVEMRLLVGISSCKTGRHWKVDFPSFFYHSLQHQTRTSGFKYPIKPSEH